MSTDYPYNSYSSHTVLGMLYKQNDTKINEREVFGIDELKMIHSVIENFIFFVQPKWKIANDIPGSGNTRNIGGITNIEKLIKGEGPFAQLGEDVFDDYWRAILTKTMRKRLALDFHIITILKHTRSILNHRLISYQNYKYVSNNPTYKITKVLKPNWFLG